jgi:hypothetical protein
MYFGGDSINGNAEELRAFYKQEYSHLDKENREEIVQAALLISRLTQRINFAFFARNDWRDQVQERERMQPRDCFNFLWCLWYSRGARLLKPPCVCCFFLIRLVFAFLLFFL